MLKIRVIVRERTTKDGRKFKSFYTLMNIVVVGEEEKGRQVKSVNLRFASDCSKAVNVNRTGTIEVDEKDIDCPSVYQVKELKDGSKKYPCVYVHNFNSFEPYRHEIDNNAFVD